MNGAFHVLFPTIDDLYDSVADFVICLVHAKHKSGKTDVVTAVKCGKGKG